MLVTICSLAHPALPTLWTVHCMSKLMVQGCHEGLELQQASLHMANWAQRYSNAASTPKSLWSRFGKKTEQVTVAGAY